MLGSGSVIRVRQLHRKDEAAWKDLYGQYRAFYRLAEDSAVVDTTWGWVVDGAHQFVGLVAVDADDTPVALANLRMFARPSTGTIGLYLDDLFTSEQCRGMGAGRSLLKASAEAAAGAGASVVRWITAADNDTARHLYDQHAVHTPWVTYDMKPTTESNSVRTR